MRTIDYILEIVRDMDGLSPTEREILRHRIEQKPTPDEIKEARLRLYPDEHERHAWLNWTDEVSTNG